MADSPRLLPLATVAAAALLLMSVPTIAQQRPASFVDASTVVPNLVVEMRYLTAHNFVGAPIDGYEKPVCYLTRQAAVALAAVAKELEPRGLVVKAFDCYRPTRAVAHFVRWARNLNDVAKKAEFYPNVEKNTLFRDGYIASRSGHSRGSTIDMTLARKSDGKDIDMGTPFDFFSTKTWPFGSQRQRGGAGQPQAAGGGYAPQRIRSVQEGMVALHAEERAVPRHVFRFPGALGTPGRRAVPRTRAWSLIS